MMDRRMHGGASPGSPVTHDFSVNLNPLGLPGAVRTALQRGLDSWDRYPDPRCTELTEAIAGYHGIAPEWICCGNGAADLIWKIVRQCAPTRALLVEPTFSEYRLALESIGCQTETICLSAADGFAVSVEGAAQSLDGVDLAFLCNPNNPTGRVLPPESIRRLADACRNTKTTLVIDESFLPFLAGEPDCSAVRLAARDPNLIVLRAFTKVYAMAGLRLGYLVSSDRRRPEEIRRNDQPWPVSVPAQQAGIAALRQKAYLKETRRSLRENRPRLADGLSSLGFCVYPGEANFILFSVPGECAPGWLYRRMLEEGIRIRDCANFIGLGPGYYRVAVRTDEENRYLLEKLKGGVNR